jgi:hypothetical protein
MKTRSSACLLPSAAILAVGIVGSSALAGIEAPDVTLEIQVFSKKDTNTPIFDDVISPTVVGPLGDPANFVWNYSVNASNLIFSLTGGLNASPLTSPTPALLNPDLVFTNTSGESLWFFVRLQMPIAQTFNLPLNWSSAPTFIYSGPSGSQIETIPDLPLWTVGVDDTPLGSAFPHHTILNEQQGNVQDNLGGILGEPVTSYMYHDFSFKMSPDAQGGPTGNFFIFAVPAPGALALLGIGAMLGGTRRRSLN